VSTEPQQQIEAKPPIKLRIFTTRGTSQIVSGTEESGDESNEASSPMQDQEDEDEELVGLIFQFKKFSVNFIFWQISILILLKNCCSFLCFVANKIIMQKGFN